MKFEICLDDVESAIAAENGGADRVELCGDLFVGGTTPSYGMMKIVRESIKIDLRVMIRPRGGDFCYSDLEFETMRHDIQIAKKIPVDGVVFGILDRDRKLDLPRTQESIDLAKPLKITFHRAFDVCIDPIQTLKQLLKLEIDLLLTSGQAEKAIDGISLIRELNRIADGKIAIMAGSGISAENASEIASKTGVSDLHIGSGCTVLAENSIHRVSAERVREIVSITKKKG